MIKTEIKLISDKYGDERRTKFGYDESEINMEDLIPRGNHRDRHDKFGLASSA